METRTPELQDEPLIQSPDRRSGTDEDVRDAWWAMLGSLYARRFLIIGVTVFAAVASVAISLTLTPWYQSTAKVILPSSGSGGLSQLIGTLDPAAAAMLGASGGDYVRYMAIISSNTMRDRVIDEFDLMSVYETHESPAPVRDTRMLLGQYLSFEIDIEYDFLAISVLDTDPQRAADMANFVVDELNRINVRLSTENARSYREFVERRYEETVANLDSSMASLQQFQQDHGVVELEQQSEAFLQILSQYRASTFEAEIEYEGLVLDYGEDNPTVRSARNRVEAARAKERALMEGKDPLMPVAFAELPEIGRGYAHVLREVMIYERIIEFARPVLEQAIFEEQREAPAVQVLDRASVPEWKTKPKRAYIVIGSTLSAFLLVLVYVVSIGWLRYNRRYVMSRIESELNQRS